MGAWGDQTSHRLKGESHSKKLTFLSSSIASEHSAFPITEISAPRVPAILDKFLSKEAQNSTYHVYVTSLRRTRNWREGEKPATDLASFTSSAKCIFFPNDYELHYKHCYHFRSLEHVLLKIIQLKSSHNPEWQLKGFSEAIWTKTLGWNDVTKTRLAAVCCSKWRQRCRILGFFGDEFYKKNLHFRSVRGGVDQG